MKGDVTSASGGGQKAGSEATGWPHMGAEAGQAGVARWPVAELTFLITEVRSL